VHRAQAQRAPARCPGRKPPFFWQLSALRA
jgi:hypothetical protein